LARVAGEDILSRGEAIFAATVSFVAIIVIPLAPLVAALTNDAWWLSLWLPAVVVALALGWYKLYESARNFEAKE
jgi:hypothetical protein